MTDLLVHITRSEKLGSIGQKGLRVTPTTKPATPFDGGDWDEERAQAYTCSEGAIEDARRTEAPKLPSRKHAIFFNPLSTFDVKEMARDQSATYPDRPLDFGHGRDVALLVDPAKIPKTCDCATANDELADAVFAHCLDVARGGSSHFNFETQVRDVWRDARRYSPGRSRPEDEDYTPEIWCQCPRGIPQSAIVERITKRAILSDEVRL